MIVAAMRGSHLLSVAVHLGYGIEVLIVIWEKRDHFVYRRQSSIEITALLPRYSIRRTQRLKLFNCM